MINVLEIFMCVTIGEESAGERSLVMVMGGSYLLLAMMILLVDEATLETGLDKAYISFNNSAASFLEKNTGLDSSGPASKLVLKFFIALWCGLIGECTPNALHIAYCIHDDK